uniref:BY PROTMAP: gi/472582605/gb/EMS20283.1/ response to drug-related protein [Rhodosporidium toruloides NP11] gi/647399075/emb/CDR43484.1/ RHTO0S08e02344g1_1 [Rhodosporidium toruloides] n=1 Tax=Rhodotorula toruloides TaxID=5286 RepID=A0A0K3CEH1_RHOTO
MSTDAERRHSSSSTLHEGPGSAQKAHGPRQVQLWDASLKGARWAFIKSAALGIVLTTLFMWACLPIYWGSYFRQPENLYRLTVGLIDLDSPGAQAAGRTPFAGPALLAAPAQLAGTNHLGFRTLDNTRFDISSANGGAPRGVDVHKWAADAVQKEDYFGVIIANANATVAAVAAYEALSSGTQATYEGMGAYTMYYSEGRNFETGFLDQYVLGSAASSLFAQLAPRLASLSATQYGAVNQTALSAVLAQPFGFSTYNLRPVDEFAGIPATTVGMLYLLIFTYFVSLFWNIARGGVESKIPLGELILLRLAVPILQYIPISLFISLVTMAFKVSFHRFYGAGGFPLFWLSNFLCMTGAGMPMEIALTFLGPRYTAFFLIFWVIINVSVAFLDLADMDHFYSYGFVLPIYQAVQNGKTIIFGTKARFGQYFGIEVAWALGGMAGLVLVIIFKRRQAVKQAGKKRAEEEKSGKEQ